MKPTIPLNCFMGENFCWNDFRWKVSKIDRFGHNSQWISAHAKIQRLMLYAHRGALFIIEMYRDSCKNRKRECLNTS